MQKGDVKNTFSENYYINQFGFNPKIDLQSGIFKFVKWYEKYNK